MGLLHRLFLGVWRIQIRFQRINSGIYLRGCRKNCKSQNGEIPYFESEKEDVKKVETTFIRFLITRYEKTPIYEGQSKTIVKETLRPLLAYHESSPDIRNFWMKSKPIRGEFWSFTSPEGKAQFGGFYDVGKCLTVTPMGVANLIWCQEPYENKAQVLCRIPLKDWWFVNKLFEKNWYFFYLIHFYSYLMINSFDNFVLNNCLDLKHICTWVKNNYYEKYKTTSINLFLYR